MKRNNFLIFKLFNFYIAAAVLAMTSCVDTVILPDNKTVDDDYWQNKSEVEGVVAKAYDQLRNSVAIRNMIVWGDFRSDEFNVSSDVSATNADKIALSQIYSMNISTDNTFTGWYPFYSAINYCNLVLEKAEDVIKNDPDYDRNDYLINRSQVLSLRAFCYFYLTRVFHDIPVTPHAYLNSSDDLNAPQMAPDSVLNMCISDLKEALNDAIPGNTYARIDGEEWRDKAFLTRDGICAVLADIYLWRASINRDANDYQACVDYCDRVIAAKKEAYEAMPHRGRGEEQQVQDYYLSSYLEMYKDIYANPGNPADETIFELSFYNSSNTGLSQMYYNLTGSTGLIKASDRFGKVIAQSDGVWHNTYDQRLYEFVFDATSSSKENFDVRKFIGAESAGEGKIQSAPGSGRATTFAPTWIFYRLTDVMLMKAEALVQLYELGGKADGDTRNEEAFAICRFVNDRALPLNYQGEGSGKVSLKYSTYADKMESLVLEERVRELCFEGKRWYDLMRYNYRHTSTKADLTKKLSESFVTNNDEFLELALRKYAVPTAMKSKIRDERYLYMPINQDEMDLNPNLVQNPAYRSSKK